MKIFFLFLFLLGFFGPLFFFKCIFIFFNIIFFSIYNSYFGFFDFLEIIGFYMVDIPEDHIYDEYIKAVAFYNNGINESAQQLRYTHYI